MSKSLEKRVYVVDDDASIRKALLRLLVSAGFTVETFPSAEEFLKVKIPQVGACLILDIHLDGMNGFALHNHLLKIGTTIPIIFITAFDDEYTHRQILKAGRPFLVKPFQEQKLIEALEALTAEQNHN